MKPEGRALDIVVVGLGQAGGNIAAEFFRRGYRAVAFNTAQTDLNALDPGGVFPSLPPERRLYIGLDGYDGAGADPVYARECIEEHGDRIRMAVLKQAAEADAIVIAAGLGGGTGSAVAELIHVLKDENLPLVALLTLPTEGESGIAKVNTVRAINEVINAPLLGWIFADNARIAALNPDIAIVDYYAHVNGQIAAPLDAMNRLNARDNIKAIRSFDGEDFRKLFLSGGILNFAVTELPIISPEEVLSAIRDCLEESDLMPAGFDMAKLSYLGVVIEAGDSVLAETPFASFEQIDRRIKEETKGGAVYHGLYRTSKDEPATLRLIAATQTLPERIRQLLGDAKREGAALGDKLRQQVQNLELGEIESVELFRTRTRPSNRPSRRTGAAGGPARPQQRRPADIIDDIAKELEEKTNSGELSKSETRAPEPARRPPLVNETPSAGALSARRRPLRGRPPGPNPQPASPRPAAPMDDADDEEETNAAELKASAAREAGTEEIDVGAKLKQVRSEGPKRMPVAFDPADEESLDELPSPDVYDHLVSAYLRPTAPGEKESVAARLERDSLSEHTVVRYYAVEAMAKLGRKSFANALLAATEDENEAVRQLATEALKR